MIGWIPGGAQHALATAASDGVRLGVAEGALARVREAAPVGAAKRMVSWSPASRLLEARRAEVTEIISDLPAISITSGSSDTMSSMALVKPCHISVNLLPPYLQY